MPKVRVSKRQKMLLESVAMAFGTSGLVNYNFDIDPRFKS